MAKKGRFAPSVALQMKKDGESRPSQKWWWGRRASNPGPGGYETPALSTELRPQYHEARPRPPSRGGASPWAKDKKVSKVDALKDRPTNIGRQYPKARSDMQSEKRRPGGYKTRG